MQSTSQLIDRVQAEIAAGRLWRAKEILRGNIASGRVEPALLEQYGQLLETLGERVEAGKYLFLSGARTPAYREAIDLFRKRHTGRGAVTVVGHLPASVRRQGFDALPAVVQDGLRDWGVDSRSFGTVPHPRARRMSWRDRLAVASILAILGVLLFAAAIGLKSMWTWAWALVRPYDPSNRRLQPTAPGSIMRPRGFSGLR